jgi:hypothetical protein
MLVNLENKLVYKLKLIYIKKKERGITQIVKRKRKRNEAKNKTFK